MVGHSVRRTASLRSPRLGPDHQPLIEAEQVEGGVSQDAAPFGFYEAQVSHSCGARARISSALSHWRLKTGARYHWQVVKSLLRQGRHRFRRAYRNLQRKPPIHAAPTVQQATGRKRSAWWMRTTGKENGASFLSDLSARVVEDNDSRNHSSDSLSIFTSLFKLSLATNANSC